MDYFIFKIRLKILIIILSLIKIKNNNLKCPPDHLIKSENIWENVNNPENYGYIFKKIASRNYFYDNWSGTIYTPDTNFCYESYDYLSIPTNLINIPPENILVFDNNDENERLPTDTNYVLINNANTNFKNFYSSGCKTVNNQILFKFEDNIPDKGNTLYFYFSIVNPYNSKRKFHFVTHQIQKISCPDLIDNNCYKSNYFQLSNEETINSHSVKRVKITIEFKNKETITYSITSSYSAQKIIAKNINNIESTKYFRFPNLNDPFNFPVKTNFEIRFVSTDDLYITSYEVMAYRNNVDSGFSLTYNGIKNSCQNNEKCIDTYGCFSNKKCEKCKDYKCKECDEKGCFTCPSNAIDEHWKHKNDGTYINECHFAFIDISNFYYIEDSEEEDYIVIYNVPPAIHFRFTLDFWIYFDDLSILNNAHVEIIYRDFMTIALTRENNILYAYCIPLEWIYEFSYEINKEFYKENLLNFINSINAPYSKYELNNKNESRIWIYVKCAYNYDTSNLYINDEIEKIIPITQIYKLNNKMQNNIPFEMKKFYGPEDTTSIILQGFYYLDINLPSYIYLRNINIYREYMPQTIELKYFNYYKFNYDEFPQLLYSIPLDDVYESSSEEFTFNSYNYYNKESNRINKEKMYLILNKKKYVLETLLSSEEIFFHPKKTFQRLNLLEVNNQNKNCDSQSTELINCNTGEICFGEYKPYICNDTSYYYLDITNIKCQDYCENGYMIPPRYNIYDKRQYCSSKCPEGNNCPSQTLFYTSPSIYFKCNNGFFNMYYKCYSENEVINERGKSGLHFGTKTNSHNIYIPLKNDDEEAYDSYVIDTWIYPDIKNIDFEKEEYVIFLTENIKIRIKDKKKYGDYENVIYKTDNDVKKMSSTDAFNLVNWNHLFISFDNRDGKSYEFFVSFNHKQYTEDTYKKEITDKIPLKSIIFCNSRQYMNDKIKDLCSDVNWLDGYYKNLRVTDITSSSRYAVFYAFQYENDNVPFIKHYYLYSLSSMSNNILTDEIGGRNGYVIYPLDNTNFNPDNTNLLNYQINFTPQDAFPEYQQYYVESYVKEKSKLIKVNLKIFENCDIAVGNDLCLKCDNSNGIQANKCYGEDKYSPQPYYVFKNPIINGPEIVSFDIDTNRLQNERAITLFFFIKIYGIMEEIKRDEDKEVKLIILDPDLYIAYHNQKLTQNLIFKYKEKVIFEYEFYRNTSFGHWIPISLSVFREYDRTFTMNMVTCSVLNTQLGFDMKNTGLISEYPKIVISEFSITNKWVGLLSDLKIYNTFMVNAWGIIKYGEEDEVARFPFRQIDFKVKESNNECIKHSDLLTDLGNTYKINCVLDFNPHLVSCSSQSSQAVIWDQGLLYGFCNGGCGESDKCLGNLCIKSVCYYSNSKSFEYKSDLWNYNFISMGQTRNIFNPNILSILSVPKIYNFDWNRRPHAESYNIASPNNTYSICFWFLSKNFRNVKNAIELYGNEHTQNFENIILIWDYHTYIKVYYNKTTNKFVAQCIPLYVINHPEYTSNIFEVNLINGEGKWSYINCGVNIAEKITYVTENDTINDQIFNPLIQIPTDKTVSLIIDENSPRGYGFTFVTDIRLWKCYSCGFELKYFEYFKEDLRFYNLLHSFLNKKDKSLWQKYDIFYDQLQIATDYSIVQVTDYPGYTIMDGIPSYIQCSEYKYNYLVGTSCQVFFNIARLYDINIEILSSKNGRYSLAFWIYIENSKELSAGLNVIWINHLSITMIKDKNDPNVIIGICFPQAFKDSVDGLSGNEIYDLYEKVDNKERDIYYNSQAKWIYVRCSVDHTRYIYNMNQIDDKILIGDTLFGNVKNHRPFRFFDWKKNYTLKIQNGQLNNCRIFLRQLRVFNEFIDKRLDEMKYIDMYIDENTLISSVVMTMDFNVYSKFDETIYAIYYKKKEKEDKIKPNTYVSSVFNGAKFKYYPTYPSLYKQNFCSGGKSTDSEGRESCQGTYVKFGLSNGKLFYPNKKNYYLNLDTLEQVDDCGNSCRNPDSYSTNTYCLFVPNSNNKVERCANSVNIARNYDDYIINFECKDGYSKIYYECIQNNLIQNSALYFSNFFSFPTLLYETEDSLLNYYIEFWFKDDYIKENLNVQNQIYFMAFPHQIIKNTNVKKFQYKYYNKDLASSLINLSSISKFEWNKIVIENLFNEDKNEYSVSIYINYKTKPEFTINLDSKYYEMNFTEIRFCNFNFDSSCGQQNEGYKWGIAWYKNIKVYKGEEANIHLINLLSDNNLPTYTQSIKYFWPFTADYIYNHEMIEKINPNDNNMIVVDWDNNNFYDDDTRENYSIENFDYSISHIGTFISGLSNDNKDFNFANCYYSCKRCYSSNSNECYECKDGYTLFNNYCKENTGFFFQTPLKDKSILYVELKKNIINDEFNFKLINTNPITITLWIKFIGIDLEQYDEEIIEWPLLYFYNKETYLLYNKDTTTFDFIIQNSLSYTINMKEFYGKWIHFGVSKYTSDSHVINYFPHMFNLMINQKILSPISPFNPSINAVYFNNIIFNTQTIVQYANMRFYNNFWFGNYGHITAELLTVDIDLIYYVKLFLGKDSCIKNEILEVEIPNIENKINCVNDYLPYEYKCGSDLQYLEYNIENGINCFNCDDLCIHNCFGIENDKCTCDFKTGKYWIKTNNDYSEYKCENIENINFALYDEFIYKQLEISKNKEKGIYFWVMIYEYVNQNFNSLYIKWDKHLKVTIEKYNHNKLLVKCYHDINLYDNSIISNYIETHINIGKWEYIRCEADINNKVYKLNQIENSYVPIQYDYYYYSELRIKENSNVNFGFSFIRELKLYSAYNFDFWDDSRIIFTKDSLVYLLHYFQFKRQSNELSSDQTTDIIKDMSYYVPQLKENRIGYNYIINYENLILCDIGFCYNEINKNCELCMNQECIITRNLNNKCLICSNNKKYLHKDDKCYDKCPTHYTENDYLSECRKCDENCENCLKEDIKKCTSCHTIYNLVKELYICVENCEDYSLTKLVDIPNMCGEFTCHGNIIYPIFLSDDFDYNENNINYKEIIIDKDNFNYINAEIVRNTSDGYSVLWIYDRLETIELNKNNINYKNENDIPNESPFDSNTDLTQLLNVKVKNSYFKYGFKYVFKLKVSKYNVDLSKSIDVYLKFILIMANPPNLDKMKSLPSSGFIDTNFLILCNQCSDIKTDYSDLEYKFSLVKNSYYLNNDEDPNEFVLQDWSKKNELFYIFYRVNSVSKEKNKYYIKCYCRNEFKLFNSTYISILVLDQNEDNDYLIEDYFDEIFNINSDLTFEQISERVSLLVTLYSYKKNFLDRTEVKNYDSNGIKTNNLNLYDPVPFLKDINCYKRGDSYLIYKFLYCICEEKYVGSVCQIKKTIYEKFLHIYKELYNKIINEQHEIYDELIVELISSLIKSASEIFLFDERSYLIQVIQFINNYIYKFPDEMIKNNRYENFFNVYYYLYEFGIRSVNQYKINNYNNENSNEKKYDNLLLRNYTMDNIQSDNIKEYFNTIIDGLNNLVIFYAKKELELKYSNKDFNIYIAIINKVFDFDNYFQDEKNKYEPYINPSLCLNELYSQKLSSIIYIGINYKISKYISNYNLYWDNVSPIVTIQFMNKNTKDQLLISNCDSNIKLYFPVSQYQIVNDINSKRRFVSPENQHYMYSSEFKDPVYIDKEGNVYKSTVNERRRNNLLYFNFSCEEIIYSDIENYYINNTKSPSLDYNKYTDDNYIICITSKLVSNGFKEFVVEYENLDLNFGINSRFFYLKRFELYKNKNNYIYNPMVYYYSLLFLFGIIIRIVFVIIIKKNPVKYSIQLNLKKETVKINLPYENIDEFDLQDSLNINEGDKRILNNLKQLPITKHLKENKKGLDSLIDENKEEKINKRKNHFFINDLNEENSNSSRPLNIKNIENNDFFNKDTDKNENNNVNNKEKVSHFFNSNPPIKKTTSKQNITLKKNKNELNEVINIKDTIEENYFVTKKKNNTLNIFNQEANDEFKK